MWLKEIFEQTLRRGDSTGHIKGTKDRRWPGESWGLVTENNYAGESKPEIGGNISHTLKERTSKKNWIGGPSKKDWWSKSGQQIWLR